MSDRFLFPDTPAISKVWSIPYNQNRNFHGRQLLLNKLEHEFSTGNRKVLALTGMAGSGKTQLVTEYVYRNKHKYPIIWWFRASSRDQLITDYKSLTSTLGYNGLYYTHESTVIPTIRYHFSQIDQNFLLVFDDAPTAVEMATMLPQGRFGHIIITSRQKTWNSIAKPIAVKRWSRNESIDYLKKRGSVTDWYEANKMAGLLCDLPLALEEAAYQITRTIPLSGHGYVDAFKKNRSQLWNEAKEPVEYSHKLKTMLKPTITGLTDHAHRLLSLLAFVHPTAIPSNLLHKSIETFLEQLAESTDNLSRTVEPIINELGEKSLVRFQSDSLMILPIVQAILQEHLDEDQQEAGIEVLVDAFNDLWPAESDTIADYKKLSLSLQPHAETCLNYADTNDLLMTSLITLALKLGYHQLEFENHALAKHNFFLALEIAEMGYSTALLALANSHIGLYYLKEEKFDDAKLWITKARKLSRRTRGERDYERLIVHKHVGQYYLQTYHYNRASLFYHRVRRSLQRIHKFEDHIDLANIYKDLGRLYNSKYEAYQSNRLQKKALKWLNKARQIYEIEPENTYPGMIDTYACLAKIYYRQEAYNDARAFISKAVALSLQYWGAHHYKTVELQKLEAILQRGPVISGDALFADSPFRMPSWLSRAWMQVQRMFL